MEFDDGRKTIDNFVNRDKSALWYVEQNGMDGISAENRRLIDISLKIGGITEEDIAKAKYRHNRLK